MPNHRKALLDIVWLCRRISAQPMPRERGVMAKGYIIQGGTPLIGEIEIHGAKNAVLPILAAAAVCGDCIIENCPQLTDVEVSVRLLESMGFVVRRQEDSLQIRKEKMGTASLPDAQVSAMRSSIVFLSSALCRFGKAELAMPGGCVLGKRPINYHLMALRRMGVQVEETENRVFCTAPNGLKGARIEFPFPSVGATETAIIAAACAKGETEIIGAAREPEVEDLKNFLNACGAKIQSNRKGRIVVQGVSRLGGCRYRIMPDRIAAGTYLSAVAAVGGEVAVRNTEPAHLLTTLACLRRAGCDIRTQQSTVFLKRSSRLSAMGRIATEPYPGFPTDMQAILMAVAVLGEGKTVFMENIFENRYRHIASLEKMGAQISLKGREAVVTGVPFLQGADMCCTDLRGGAALTVAALSARGTSRLYDIHHIKRGYQDFAENFTKLGAKIIEKTIEIPE